MKTTIPLMVITAVFLTCDCLLETIKVKVGEIDGIVKQVETALGNTGSVCTIKDNLTRIMTGLNKDGYMEGIQNIKDLVEGKDRALEGTSYPNATREKIHELLKNLVVKAEEMQDILSEKLDIDIESALKKLNLEKLPDGDVSKLQPLTDIVKSVITNFTKSKEIPPEIKTIMDKVKTYLDNKDLQNGIKEARKINSTFLKIFDNLSVDQLGMLGDFETGVVALQNGMNTQLAERIQQQEQTKNDGPRTTLGPLPSLVMLCLSFVKYTSTG